MNSDTWPIRISIYGAGEAIDGANALSSNILAQLGRLAQVSTNPYVAALAQLDSSNNPTLRYVLDPSGRQPVYQLANVNVGDPSSLTDFAAWSAALCAADVSVLVLSGHGAAWQDGMVDAVLGRRGVVAPPTSAKVAGAIHHPRSIFGTSAKSSGAINRAILIDGGYRDYLSNAELRVACERISSTFGGKIDVIVFDACLMSSWELLHELSGVVRATVASIDELSAAGIDMSRPVRTLTDAEGQADAFKVATSIVQAFTPQSAFDSCVAISLEDANWGVAIEAFRMFCGALRPWLLSRAANTNAMNAALREASTSLVEFNSGGLADIGALASAIAAIPGIPADIVDRIDSAVAALKKCVLGSSAGKDYQSAMGLSIFSPNSANVYASNRADYARLQFPFLTGWSDILDATYGYAPALESPVSPAPPANDPPAPTIVAGDDIEFAVSLRGFPIDGAISDRIGKSIRRAVLTRLVEVDLLDDTTISPLASALSSVWSSANRATWPIGFVVASNKSATGIKLSTAFGDDTKAPRAPSGSAPSTEFRVALRGLKLDDATCSDISSAIRSAALAEIASFDAGASVRILDRATDQQPTRSLLSTALRVLGYVLNRDDGQNIL